MAVKRKNPSIVGESWAAKRRFLAMQCAKAGFGAALSLAYFWLLGRPDLAEAGAMVVLLLPAPLGLLAFTSVPLSKLESLSLATFAALIGYLSILTGGLASPIIVWLVLVPAEAALAGEKPAVTRAGFAAGAAVAVVAIVEALGILPVSRLPHAPTWEIFAASTLAAIIQAALIAAAAQDRQRAADKAAAEGAAMYRFLADNAMDLITRH